MLFRPEVAIFACGLTLLWVGGLALRMARIEHRGWLCFAAFALLGGVAQGAVLATGTSDPSAALRYGFALPGVVASIALAQVARNRQFGWTLYLASAAAALLVLGLIVSVPALQAFAALGLLVGIWGECRVARPLPPTVGVVKRCQAPVAFALLLISGVIGVSALAGESDERQALAVVASDQSSGANEPGSAVNVAPVEIDSRALARRVADETRVRQGLFLVGVLAVLAVAWMGLSRFATAK